MPPDVRSWKQNAKISVDGKIATKYSWRELIMKDGSTRKLEKTE
jgi:hypothetical protein